MGTIEGIPANCADAAAYVAVDCFGERGMAHCPDRPHRIPIAAGLFGLPFARMPRPSNDAGSCSGRMTAA